MKKLRIYFVIIALGVLMTQCTKEGPMGPAGTDGTDGVDGNVTCLQCHTQTHMDSVTAQWNTSAHGIGTYVGYAGGRNECARCHSGAGFIEHLDLGIDTTLAYPEIPGTNIGCSACHSGHKTFEPQDDALRLPGGSYSIVDTTLMDLGNNGNACIACHQPRRNWESYWDETAGDYYVNSPYAGPHHGPQSAILLGIGGTISGTAHTHKTAGCTTCHMGNATAGYTEGGHTFRPNNENCTQCHTVPTDFDYNGYKTEMETNLATLEGKLKAAGILDAAGATFPGHYSSVVYKAWWNYEIILNDGSDGIHNPPYAETLITASIASLP
ncbi:MAG: hypothetical protein GXO80_03360 [Chlorobi bacterium]|nr:hypothetical protein [Chlorobiota bacterium]